MTSAPKSTRCDVIAAGPSSEHSITRIPSSMGAFSSAMCVTPSSNRRQQPSLYVRLLTPVGEKSTGPHHGLHLGVGQQSEVATVAADAAHLEPAERRFHVALRGV